jgi:hypothetical protein
LYITIAIGAVPACSRDGQVDTFRSGHCVNGKTSARKVGMDSRLAESTYMGCRDNNGARNTPFSDIFCMTKLRSIAREDSAASEPSDRRRA